jgi:hypothetical protein
MQAANMMFAVTDICPAKNLPTRVQTLFDEVNDAVI